MVLKNKCHFYRSKSWDVWNHLKTNPRKRNNPRNILLVQLVRTIILTCFSIHPHICSTPPLDTNITMKKNNTWGPSCEQQQHQLTTTSRPPTSNHNQPIRIPRSHLLGSVELGKGRFKDFFETWPVFCSTFQANDMISPLPLCHNTWDVQSWRNQYSLRPTVPAQNWANFETKV